MARPHGRTAEESYDLQKRIFQSWKDYERQCLDLPARPNARAFVQKWNQENPGECVSYVHFAKNIKRGV